MAEKSGGGEASTEKGKEVTSEVVVELQAPPGWQKKFMPKMGGTPRRNEIVFISPTGEEIKNKKQLDQYLKSHPGGPQSSEFEWGTGDTPRRSARISEKEKAKATETPEGEKPQKRERKSSTKKVAKDKKDDDEDDELTKEKEDAAKEEAKDHADVEMKEADEGGEEVKDEDTTIEVAGNKLAVEQDSEDKTKGSVEEKPVDLEKNGPEEASKVDLDASLSEGGKDKKEADDKPTDSEVVPPASETKLEASSEKEIVVEVLPEKSSHNDNEDTAAVKQVPSVNCDDGQHQAKTSAVSC